MKDSQRRAMWVRLRNYQKPLGYKYYQHFDTPRGCIIIYSRNGKKHYITSGKDFRGSYLLPNYPFAKASKAISFAKKVLQ